MSKQDRHLYEFGPFRLDVTERLLWRDDKPVTIPPMAFDTLVALVERHGHLVLKDELLKIVWPDSFVEEGNLTNNISILRKALGESAGEHRYIETVPRRGYRFVAAVEEAPYELTVKERARSSVIIEEEEEISPPPQSTEMTEAPASGAKRRARRMPPSQIIAVCIALLAPALGVAGWLHFSLPTPAPPMPPMRIVPFTSFPDGAWVPTFSPDGNQIAFVWGGEKGDNADIYTQLVDGGNPLRLTSDPAFDTNPTWAPDGRRVAFVRISGSRVEIFTVLALGGVERKLLSLDEKSEWGYVTSLTWSPDGKFIAYSDRRSINEPKSLFLLSVESLEKQRLTFPPEQYLGDINAVFSRDGQSLAFKRYSSQVAADLYIMPIAGEARRLTFDNAIIGGLTWTEDGLEIVFASTRMGVPSLWRVSGSGGSPKQLSITGENAGAVSISSQGHRLAYEQCFNPNSNVYRIYLPSSPDHDGSSTALIHSTRHDNNPQISPDGKRIAFESDRTGGHEVWICDSDGSNPHQVTLSGGRNAGSPRWSPDGRQIAFDSVLKGDSDIYVIDTEGGNPRRVTDEKSDEVTPSWSHDGRWIYFGSNRSGRWEVWKLPAEGGAAVQVTRRGGALAFEAPDGKFVYYSKFGGLGIWRTPVKGGEEEVVVDSFNAGPGNWAVVGAGIYFIKLDAKAGAAIEFYNFATRQVNEVAALGKVKIWILGLAVSPDRQWILYTREDPGNTGNIMMVENFR